MQATATTPAPPAPAIAPVAPTPQTITFVAPNGATQVLTVPMTKREVQALRSQRSEISSQLSNVTDRRREVAEELAQTAAGPARTGLEQRLAVLDTRIATMEADLAATGRQLSAAAPMNLIGEPADFPKGPGGGDIPDNVMTVIGLFTVFVFFPIAFSISRMIWRRASRIGSPAATAQVSPHIDQRLERLEQGVDAIAIEIERVTEGQRFVTRLLSEQDSREKLPASAGPTLN